MKEDRPDFSRWPAVPLEQRPKRLYHCGLIDQKADQLLVGRGWMPIDVRLLPNVTDDDRRLALKAWLEGIRFGTIELDPRLAKWLELEAKVYEIHKGVPAKTVETDNDSDSSKSLDFVLDFARQNPWTTTTADKQSSTKKMRGRRPAEFDQQEEK